MYYNTNMLYFSELDGKKVYTEDRIEIGTLDDIIFIVSSNPKVSKLVIRPVSKTHFMLPFQYVVKMNEDIVIKKSYQTIELEENELYIKRNILDKQIIDIGGNKVVRVNDVTLQETITTERHELYITGVDIGFLGILRRLGIESYAYTVLHPFHIYLSSHFLSWADVQPLELSSGKVKLRKREEKLENMRPEDLADYLEKTNERNVYKFLRILDKKFAAEVIGNLNINYQRELFLHFDPEKSARMLELISDEEAVDILLAIPKKRREEIFSYVNEHKKYVLEQLLKLSKTTIGKIISSEFLSVAPTSTVYEVMEKVRKETIEYTFLAAVYVLNSQKQLVGIFNLHDLLLHDKETPVFKFMIQNLIEIRLTTPIEIAVRKMLRYHLPALPVVDNDKHLLGVLTFDHVAGFIQKRFE